MSVCHHGVGASVCRHCEGLDQLRADLATALRESAGLIAQRDTALGLLNAERAAHAVTQGRLDSAREMRDVYHRLEAEARAELAETRKALEEAQYLVPNRGDGSCCICGCAPSTLESLCADCRVAKCDGCVDLESTRAELARSEARVKAVQEALDAEDNWGRHWLMVDRVREALRGT